MATAHGDCTPALNPTLLLPSGVIWNWQESLTAVNSCSNVGGNFGLTQIKYPSAVDCENVPLTAHPPSWSNSLVLYLTTR